MLSLSTAFTSRLLRLVYKSCSSVGKPNMTEAEYRSALSANGWRDLDPTGKKSEKTHLSQSEQLISRIPVIRSHQDVVRCMGGTQVGAGHPQVYIQLNTKTPGEPVSCKYCGLQYALDVGHHH